MFSIKLLIITSLIHIAISNDVRFCNNPLVNKNNANTFSIQTPTNQNLAELGTNVYWQLTGGEYRTMRIQFNTPHYVTGIGIKVNTDSHAPCNNIETTIVLSEFEVVVDNKRVDLANRNIVNNTFIKVSTPPVFGTNFEIRKFVGKPNNFVYCVQYQLYGCVEVPSGCRPLLSYDTTQPVNNDNSYTGVCMAGRCSGGLGGLFDNDYKNSLRWEGTTRFSLSFYQQVGIDTIAIYTNSSVTIATESMLPNITENGYIRVYVGKTINFFEFDVTTTQGRAFDLQEIKISYWSDLSIICGSSGGIEMTTIWISIGVGLFMFMVGLALPIVIWFTRGRILKRGGGKGNVGGGELGERTEHVYTDIQSKASTAQVNDVHRVNIVDRVTIATGSLPHWPKENSSMEEQVRQRALEREEKINSPIDTLQENPLYSTSDPDKFARNYSEILTRENPQYVTNEMMKQNSASKDKVNYENSVVPVPRNDSLFNAYDKLDRNPSK